MQDIFNSSDYPELLVGLTGPDDAAVWQLDDTRALVVTTDFFTPVVDNPYDFGAIAAANSLSDVYAMGGKPFLALNIAALPEDLPIEITSEILRGGAEKAIEAGVVIAGGHTVKDKEPKYGLVVIGIVNPQKIIRKGGLKVSDALVLTKPLGFGLTTTALKRDQADGSDVEEVAGWMKQLNNKAGQLAIEFDLHAGTDITGFGLLGHCLEMSNAAGNGGLALEIKFDQIPFVNGTRKYAILEAFAGGLLDNRSYFGPSIEFAATIDKPSQMMLFDPQTSGGLLLGVAQDKLGEFTKRAYELNQSVWVIGEVKDGKGIRVK